MQSQCVLWGSCIISIYIYIHGCSVWWDPAKIYVLHPSLVIYFFPTPPQNSNSNWDSKNTQFVAFVLMCSSLFELSRVQKSPKKRLKKKRISWWIWIAFFSFPTPLFCLFSSVRRSFDCVRLSPLSLMTCWLCERERERERESCPIIFTSFWFSKWCVRMLTHVWSVYLACLYHHHTQNPEP